MRWPPGLLGQRARPDPLVQMVLQARRALPDLKGLLDPPGRMALKVHKVTPARRALPVPPAQTVLKAHKATPGLKGLPDLRVPKGPPARFPS